MLEKTEEDPIMLESRFNALMNKGRFDEAATLLKEELVRADFVDPRDDYSWGPASDVLGYRILEEQDARAFNAYWRDLLAFFQEDLEPKWGHLHKGHLYFRLGLGYLGSDLTLAGEFLEEALAEDRLVASAVAGNWHTEVETLVHRFPSYVTLCILERIGDGFFASEKDRQRFYRGLIPLRFDVVWDRKEVEMSLVHHAIETIVSEPGRELALATRQELTLASAQQLRTATLSLLASYLEIVLSSILYYTLDAREIEGQSIQGADLGALLRESAHRKIFPSDSIQSTCQLVHILQRELLRPGPQAYRYEVNANIVEYIGYSLKILLDSALVKWASEVG
jgi:tetratricopeptide (TPR) repeat protein